MISSCKLKELPSTGNGFTWGGMRSKMWIQSRLDRRFGNSLWFTQFPNSNQAFLEKRGSDHRPVLVYLIKQNDSKKGRFCFDKRLIHKPETEACIRAAWLASKSSYSATVNERMKSCRQALSKFKRDHLVNSQDKLVVLQRELESEQSNNFPDTCRVDHLKKELVYAYREEELFWKQKSRETWLKEGDANTKFFHNSVKSRRAHNYLEMLRDANGVPQKAETSKGDVACNYFTKLFTSSNPPDFEDLFEGFTHKVSDQMNQSLLKQVSKGEIYQAVCAIKASSAPGPDGLTAVFFQKYWHIVGEQITKEVCDFFTSGNLPSAWNYTHICLIPKKPNPDRMEDMRPISLCSVVYKIIAKIMVKRLQPFLPQIISQSQTAFVSNRLITDNILLAHEMIHALNTHPKISAEYMAIKTDISKAYDRIEWKILRSILLALGFSEMWVNLVMECVTSVTYSVLVNGAPHGFIRPSRGLRQGDPLSPFLFVICTEALVFLMHRAEARGHINGMHFRHNGPSISHLLFADDSLFICKVDSLQVFRLQQLLRTYSTVSGQVINTSKSAITFGANVSQTRKFLIKNSLGIFNEGGVGKYLGLPECFSGSKIKLLSYIRDSLKGRVSNWFSKLLSQGGKEILLKTVALALPVYAMSCFKFPKSTCQSLSSVMASFWWDSLPGKKKVHWISWERMCLSKENGGLGFRDLQSFNQALLAKQAWLILTNQDSLLTRFFKSRYFPDNDFLKAKISSRPSYAWRSLLFGRDLLLQGLEKRIGDGRNTSVWLDDWIMDEFPRAPWFKNVLTDVDLMVKDIIDFEHGCWNMDMLENLFYQADIQLITRRNPVIDHEDFWIWKFTQHGAYTVKSGFHLAEQERHKDFLIQFTQLPNLNDLKAQVWTLKAPKKIKVFLWKAISGALPVAETLVHRGIKVDPRCQACGVETETINHALITCPAARIIWTLSNIPWPQNGYDEVSFPSNFHYLLSQTKGISALPQTSRFPWYLWQIWKNRNHLALEGKRFDSLDTNNKILEDSLNWNRAQEINRDWKENEKLLRAKDRINWKPPAPSWISCDIGFSWNQNLKLCGGAWVVRNSSGSVLLHSRRAFPKVNSLYDAQDACLSWAFESMGSHHFSRVVFSANFPNLFGVLLKPHSWLAFLHHRQHLFHRLQQFQEWELQVVEPKTIMGATLIAKSVTKDLRLQSYVASGYPNWLNHIFGSQCG